MNPRPTLILEGVVVPFEPDGVRFTFDILGNDGQRYLCFAAPAPAGQPAAAELPVVREGDRVRLRGRWSAALKCVFEVSGVEMLEEFAAPEARREVAAARQ
ncbi:MAG TPA: hypothetical protein VH105_22500 [Burkholderiales bacterium]|nr:hypothetical protein [Burkholderiales bacterium]